MNATNGTVTRTIAFPSNLIASGQSIIEDIAGYDGYHVLTVLLRHHERVGNAR